MLQDDEVYSSFQTYLTDDESLMMTCITSHRNHAIIVMHASFITPVPVPVPSPNPSDNKLALF